VRSQVGLFTAVFGVVVLIIATMLALTQGSNQQRVQEIVNDPGHNGDDREEARDITVKNAPLTAITDGLGRLGFGLIAIGFGLTAGMGTRRRNAVLAVAGVAGLLLLLAVAASIVTGNLLRRQMEIEVDGGWISDETLRDERDELFVKLSFWVLFTDAFGDLAEGVAMVALVTGVLASIEDRGLDGWLAGSFRSSGSHAVFGRGGVRPGG
jgi:hypothetical protein